MNYREIIENVLVNGVHKQPTRTKDGKVVDVENATIGTFSEVFRHDMSKGFPLSTLRRMPFKSTAVELEGFIKGVCDKKWYQDRKCHYWDHWASPQAVRKHPIIEEFSYDEAISREELEKEYSSRERAAQKDSKDLGDCFYGASWRNFRDPNGGYNEVDQLAHLVRILTSSPYNRRMVVSSWNPLGMDHTALHWCHHSFTVCVYGDKLNLAWDQRSCDLLVNQTIVTYGLLLLLLCEESGLKPGELCGRFIDCHIYENQLEQAKELVKREELGLPFVKIKRKPDGSFNIFEWTHEELELTHYHPHGKIDMGKVTV